MGCFSGGTIVSGGRAPSLLDGGACGSGIITNSHVNPPPIRVPCRKPSREDIEMTKEIRKAAEAQGITIHDHLVIGRKDHASFRSLGLI